MADKRRMSPSWWTRVLQFMSLPLFYIGLAGVPTNIQRWWHGLGFVANHVYLADSHPIAWRCVSGVLAFGLAFYNPIKNHFSPIVSVDLLPTSGPREEMELRVTNRGDVREFYAQCELVALRNSPNHLAQVTYSLKWDATNAKRCQLGKGESANLLIAKADIDHKNALAEMELLGLYGEQVKRYEWSRWTTTIIEAVPEYDLRISIFSDGAKMPLQRMYTLRPKTFHGPLEMVELASGVEA